MDTLRRKIYFAAGYYTVSFGAGRKEFSPEKPRPGLEHYIQEAGKGTLAMLKDPSQIDEGVIGNFMAARFNHQGHLACLIPTIHPSLEYKPCTRVEGACASGGLALTTGIKSVLAETADAVLVVGVEVQNTVKAIYGADYLAGAGHYQGDRKVGHAYYFPAKFSDRAGAYFAKFGADTARKAMATWYAIAVENARHNPKAQEFQNTMPDLFAVGMTPPNPEIFCEHINFYDCSKVSDGASSVIIASEEGLKKLGIQKEKAVELVGFGQSQGDLTKVPQDLTRLSTTEKSVDKAYKMAKLSHKDIGLLEVHDCFTITGLLSLESAGFATYGKSAEMVLEGKTKRDGDIPTNTTGGLIGYGHYTGGTGVRQSIDILNQLTGNAGDCQIKVKPEKPYGLMISMGGNDKSVVCCIFKKAVVA